MTDHLPGTAPGCLVDIAFGKRPAGASNRIHSILL